MVLNLTETLLKRNSFFNVIVQGYIVEHLLNRQLTVVEEFHSHLEPMKFLKVSQLPEQVPLVSQFHRFKCLICLINQITFSYSHYGSEMNVLNIEGSFSRQADPYRFLSIHCLLFPNFSFCPR